MRPFLLTLSLLLLTACLGKSPAAPSPIDESVVVAQGQTVEVASGVSIELIRVLNDSRCPIDGICIQGGDALVRVAVRSGGARGERDLHTGSLAPVTFDDLEVRLVDLHPYPFSSRPFDPSEYKATVRVLRR